MSRPTAVLLRYAALLAVAFVALQLWFALRIALMIVVDPQSTTFQRSEMWRLATQRGELLWSQQWRDGGSIADNLKRAVIASEDAGFVEHRGVEWDALEKAWEKNQRAESRAERINERLGQRAAAALSTQAPRGGSGGRACSAGAGRAEGHRRLDHHPAAGQEPVPEQRAQLARGRARSSS